MIALGGNGAPREVAEELVDEALALAWKNWAEVSQMDAPQGWAYKTAVNLWRNKRRRMDTERRLFGKVSSKDESTDDPIVEFYALIEHLPARQRQVLIMR